MTGSISSNGLSTGSSITSDDWATLLKTLEESRKKRALEQKKKNKMYARALDIAALGLFLGFSGALMWDMLKTTSWTSKLDDFFGQDYTDLTREPSLYSKLPLISELTESSYVKELKLSPGYKGYFVSAERRQQDLTESTIAILPLSLFSSFSGFVLGGSIGRWRAYKVAGVQCAQFYKDTFKKMGVAVGTLPKKMSLYSTPGEPFLYFLKKKVLWLGPTTIFSSANFGEGTLVVR